MLAEHAGWLPDGLWPSHYYWATLGWEDCWNAEALADFGFLAIAKKCVEVCLLSPRILSKKTVQLKYSVTGWAPGKSIRIGRLVRDEARSQTNPGPDRKRRLASGGAALHTAGQRIACRTLAQEHVWGRYSRSGLLVHIQYLLLVRVARDGAIAGCWARLEKAVSISMKPRRIEPSYRRSCGRANIRARSQPACPCACIGIGPTIFHRPILWPSYRKSWRWASCRRGKRRKPRPGSNKADACCAEFRSSSGGCSWKIAVRAISGLWRASIIWDTS